MKTSAIEKFLVTVIFILAFVFLLMWTLTNHTKAETYKPPQHSKKIKPNKKRHAMRVSAPNPVSPPVYIPASPPLFFQQPRIEHTSFPFVVVQGPVNLGLTPFRAIFEPEKQPYPTYIWHQPWTLPRS